MGKVGVEFSIIIPVYNVKDYLIQCIESVLYQKADEFAFEIILVDDGSTDGSDVICDNYNNRNNIKVIHKENGGLGNARNVGMDYASGKYLWFLDSDDFIESNSLEKIYAIIKNQDIDILFFGAQCFSDDNNPLIVDHYRRINCLNTKMTGKSYLSKVMIFDEYYSSVCLRVFRRDFLGNSRFCESILHEDEDFGFIATLRAESVYVINDRLYHRRYRNNSIMMDNNLKKRIDGYYYACEKISEYYKFSYLDQFEQDLCTNRCRRLIDVILTLYFDLNINEKRKMKKYLQQFLKKVSLMVCLNGLKYQVAKFNVDLYCLCKRICDKSRKIKYRLWIIKKWPQVIWNVKCMRRSPKILLLGTPFHGNYGDHLIAEVEMEMLKQNCKKTVLECPMIFINEAWNFIKRNVTSKDVLLISGGGWMGTLWRHNELFIRRVIKEYPNNKVIILPQTVYYEGDDEFIKSGKNLYASHKQLNICVREKASYDFFIDNEYCEPQNLHLMPDCALLSSRLSSNNVNSDRKFCGYCFRDDVEKIIDDELKESLIKEISRYGEIIKINTNDEGEVITPFSRMKKLKYKFEQFYELQFLITDRLHAMIIAFLTETPCFFLDNKTNKVSGVYEWIKDCGYIYKINSVNEFRDVIDNITINKNIIDRDMWIKKLLIFYRKY